MALLPATERMATADRALRQLSDGASQEVLLLVGAASFADARTAAASAQAAIPRNAWLEPVTGQTFGLELQSALAFYQPYRDRLLTDVQRTMLQVEPQDVLIQRAVASLYQFSSGPRFASWREDPLNLLGGWWSERASVTRVQPRDGWATFEAEGKHWIVLRWHLLRPAFSMSGDTELADLLETARVAARRAVPDVALVAAGVPLHVEAAAAQASRETNLIGFGSLAAVLLLVWLAFHAFRPIILVGLSLVVGTAAALSVTALVFPQVHLLTVVFGASLVGVAEEYGIHYFVTRQADPRTSTSAVLRRM